MNTGIHAKKRMVSLFKLMWYEASYLLVVWSQVDYSEFVGYEASLHFLILIAYKTSRSSTSMKIHVHPLDLSAVVTCKTQRLGFGMSTSKRLLRCGTFQSLKVEIFEFQTTADIMMSSRWSFYEMYWNCTVRNLDEWFVTVFDGWIGFGLDFGEY